MTQMKNLVYGCTEYMGSFFKEDCVPVMHISIEHEPGEGAFVSIIKKGCGEGGVPILSFKYFNSVYIFGISVLSL